ncbi:inositol polyphosphate 5-phosphatase [Clydaea vesicula]|uniref:Inositol polyphosphate 5-phosphatase n=1 Tax=Clydaea vesicula TaxID=447962 RepID=A0AAD5U1R0_9FUNG|nr:inositol polyphosphate 5-phosphatase [Clydaea vesicula]
MFCWCLNKKVSSKKLRAVFPISLKDETDHSFSFIHKKSHSEEVSATKEEAVETLPINPRRSSLLIQSISKNAHLSKLFHFQEDNLHRNRSKEVFSKKESLKVFIGTWNMNGKVPKVNLEGFLKSSKSCHLVVIGTQESQKSIEQSLIYSNFVKWETLLLHHLNLKKEKEAEQYELVKTDFLIALHISVFVLKKYKHLVKATDSGKIATGIGNVVGNKGAVAVSLLFGKVSILFVNSHLSAHQKRVAERNNDYNRINQELKLKGYFPTDAQYSNLVDKFDFVFWFGDLNYRINGLRKVVLLNNDQLFNEMKKGNAFKGFWEDAITFPPTYKYSVVDQQSEEKKLSTKRSQQSLEKNVLENQETYNQTNEENIGAQEITYADRNNTNEKEIKEKKKNISSIDNTNTHKYSTQSLVTDELQKKSCNEKEGKIFLKENHQSPLKYIKIKTKTCDEEQSITGFGNLQQECDLLKKGSPRSSTATTVHTSSESLCLNGNFIADTNVTSTSFDQSLKTSYQLLKKGNENFTNSYSFAYNPRQDRIPSWTDRILFKSRIKHHNDYKQLRKIEKLTKEKNESSPYDSKQWCGTVKNLEEKEEDINIGEMGSWVNLHLQRKKLSRERKKIDDMDFNAEEKICNNNFIEADGNLKKSTSDYSLSPRPTAMIKTLLYNSISEYTFSDHKPVIGAFLLNYEFDFLEEAVVRDDKGNPLDLFLNFSTQSALGSRGLLKDTCNII